MYECYCNLQGCCSLEWKICLYRFINKYIIGMKTYITNQTPDQSEESILFSTRKAS